MPGGATVPRIAFAMQSSIIMVNDIVSPTPLVHSHNADQPLKSDIRSMIKDTKVIAAVSHRCRCIAICCFLQCSASRLACTVRCSNDSHRASQRKHRSRPYTQPCACSARYGPWSAWAPLSFAAQHSGGHANCKGLACSSF